MYVFVAVVTVLVVIVVVVVVAVVVVVVVVFVVVIVDSICKLALPPFLSFDNNMDDLTEHNGQKERKEKERMTTER